MNGLFCVVTGLEHSGTTIVANALKSTQQLMGGFECGLALDPIPQPFLNYFVIGGEHWGLTEAQRQELLALDTKDAYTYLQRSSPLMLPTELLVDKTPAYCLDLPHIMEKLDVPFVVVEKTLSNWMKSNQKRQHLRPYTTNDYYLDRWKQYKRSLNEVENVYILQFEDIESEIEEVFAWLGLVYEKEYLSGNDYMNKVLTRTGKKPGRELFEGWGQLKKNLKKSDEC